MPKPRLLDIFCGAGGCSTGYSRAGFDVVGVDFKAMPRYPFEFHQGDALEFLAKHGHEFDAIHASPPCQAFCTLRHLPNAKKHPDLVDPTRKLLVASGKPYVIENVPGAPLREPTMLCGTMFGLGTGDADLRRHRLFETNWPLVLPFGMFCRHGRRAAPQPDTIGIYGTEGRARSVGEIEARRSKVIGIYGGHTRDRRLRSDSELRLKAARTISVHDSIGRGHDHGSLHRHRQAKKGLARPARFAVNGHTGGSSQKNGLLYFTTAERNEAMGIDWMRGTEISQAIPPAYTEFIGRQLIAWLEKQSTP